LELGTEWRDAAGETYALSWIVDTGELYLMLDEANAPTIDPFGDAYPTPEDSAELRVEVLGMVETSDELHRILVGWEDAEVGEDGVGWLRTRLADEGHST